MTAVLLMHTASCLLMCKEASTVPCCRSWAELGGCIAGVCTMPGVARNDHHWLAWHCVTAADTPKLLIPWDPCRLQ